MPETLRLEGQLLTPSGWVQGQLRSGERITEITPSKLAARRFIVPGFIDVHVHGGAGGDTMDGPDGLYKLTRFHAQHGTTALLATTITNPWDRVLEALEGVQRFTAQAPDGARVLGVHLEGPFISPGRLGAQPPNTVLATPERLRELLAFGVIRVVTIAPELPGALEAIEQLLMANVRVSLGHTRGSAEDANAAFALAVRLGKSHLISGTHLYNAMGGLEGRNPGVLGALLANDAAYAELILDGHHVHQSAFLAAYRAKPERLMLITDAMRAAGLPDGNYDLGGQLARLEGGAVHLPGGSLAGSVLTMHTAVVNAVAAGVPLEIACRLASLHPAQYLGLSDYGKLEVGAPGDIVVLTEDLELEAVYVGGRPVA